MKSTNTFPLLLDPDYLVGVQDGESVLVPHKIGVSTGATRETDPSEVVRINKDGTLVRSGGAPINLGGSAGLSGVTYDSTNRVTAFSLRGIDYTVAYATGLITVTGSNGSTREITLDTSARISGVT